MTRRLTGRRAGLAAVLALAGLAGGGAAAAQPGAGYTLHGSGTPAVVLQAGLGDGQASWRAALPALSAAQAVLAIDRPGHGEVPAGDAPRDPCSVAEQQRALLREAGVPPPYVLVGHSLGGLYQLAYARLYPQEVAALVLLDPTHPRHWATMQAEVPGTAALVKAMRAVAFSRVDREEFDAQAQCLERLALEQPAPALPVRLLFSGRFRFEEGADYQRMLQGLRRDWLRLAGATPAQATTLWDSGHYLHQERPDAVADAVRSVRAQAAGQPAPDEDAASPDAGPAASAEAASTPAPSLLSRRLPPCIPGQTTQAQLRAAMGEPDETLGEEGQPVWVYADPMDKLPAVAGWLPVLGDVLDAVNLLRTRQEWIVHFDARGVVTRQRLRPLN